ncbi:DUF3619 family protein [Caldimonas caldifontis]|uniref:DUF3619 domain-containing protein n=1 Tax=Caldimonas caldifontis TaxID=1452508 RepID=A0A2S5ST02_9BURK|nr:DUF3619 family protein [Caldimonas caldifontis]PPE65868.1 DUF3619 domain-containing protein [Caldimonas caldifontis]
MNHSPLQSAETEVLEARVGLLLAAHLSDAPLPPDITERLRFARAQAVARRRVTAATTNWVVSASGAAALGRGPAGQGGERRWWAALGGLLPLLALLGGLLLIDHWETERQIQLAAEIDAMLLADDLPPAAYADPGFLEFLRTPRE